MAKGMTLLPIDAIRMVNPMTDTTHRTGSQFARPKKEGVMGKYPSVSGFAMN